MKKSYIPILLILVLSFIPNVYSANDYIQSSGSVGGLVSNNNLILLKAGHSYFYVFSSTESLSITAIAITVWQYDGSNPDYNYTNAGVLFYVAHLDFSIYEGSKSTDISPSNPMIKSWTLRNKIINGTGNQEITINPANYGGKAYPTKSNTIIAVSVTPSVDIYVNSTSTTTYTQYQLTGNPNVITKFTTADIGRTDLTILWNMLKGSISEDISAPISASVVEPSEVVNDYSVFLGVNRDGLGIAVFSFMLLSMIFTGYKYHIPYTEIIATILTIILAILFTNLKIIPLWFAITAVMLAIGLLSAIKYGNGESAEL